MGELTGTTLGRYEILERIGQGGMAAVYKAYQPALDRYVAIKVLHSFLLEQATRREHFQREARAVAALRHPHIVQVIDYDVVGDLYFMVMELIEGLTLKQVLEGQARIGARLPLEQVGLIITAIGGALSYAHDQGLIHRDVKPQNIMFTRAGQPTLTDFGIAKIVSGASVSGSGVLSGTPAYMSPEQGRGGPLDARTDIYSLGVVLYEIVTGHVPFDADTPFAVVLKHVNDPPPPPRQFIRDLPPAVEQVVLQALAKDPHDRFQTTAALVTATQAALSPADAPVFPAAAAHRGRATDPAPRDTGTPVTPETLGGQLIALRKLLGLSQAQVAAWIQGPQDEAPPVERIQHWEHNRRRPRTRGELLIIVAAMRKLNPTLITLERVEQLITAYNPRIPITVEERATLFPELPAVAVAPPPHPMVAEAVSPAPAEDTPPLAHTDSLPPCPYRGLFAFREEDALFFHGRDAFTARLVAAVQERTLVAVLGPSGSGKSSVVFAGLLPQVPPGAGWLSTACRPGARPFHALAAALIPLLEGPTTLSETDRLVEINKLAERLADQVVSVPDVVQRIVQKDPAAQRLLLVLDQFEEVFTLCPQADRQRFLDCLVAAVRTEWPRRTPVLTLVLTLRADFLGQALAHRPLADALQEADLKLGPMTRSELQVAIDRPAAQVGVAIEEGLTERILDAVSTEPGDLPLLEFALTLLWGRQHNRTLTHAAYEAIGGVEQALAGYADEVYAQLTAAEQQRAQHVFTQLVRPGEGTEDTRRRASRAEVGDTNWDLVAQLADARLVVTGRDAATRADTVEIVHEALIRGWDRLRTWMDADREFRLWQERLRATARQWLASGQDEGVLLRGGPLAEAESWLQLHPMQLSTEEEEFLAASLGLRVREAQARAHERAERTRLGRWAVLGLSAGLFAALVLAVLAVLQAQQADLQRQVADNLAQLAQRQARVAQAEALAAQASTPERATELGVLLAMEAISATKRMGEPPLPQAVSALHWAVGHSQVRLALRGHTDTVWSATYSPDGKTILTASEDKTARLWDAVTGQVRLTLQGHTGAVRNATFSPDGRRILTASVDHTAKVWDAATGQELLTLQGHTATVWSAVYSPDGRYILTASEDKTAKIWDAASGQELHTLVGHTEELLHAVYSPDGRSILTASSDQTAKVWDAATGQVRLTLQGHTAKVIWAEYSPDGQRIVTASDDQTAKIWDATSGQELQTLSGHTDGVTVAAFSPSGAYILTTSADKTAKIWDASSGQERSTLRGHTGRVRGAGFSPDGRGIVTASDDATALVWATTPEELPTLVGHTSTIWMAAYSPDGASIATASADKTAKIWDAATGQERITLAGHTDGLNSVAYSPDGRFVVTASDDKTARIWDSRTGQVRVTLAGHAGGVTSASYSPDGAHIVTTSYDKTAKIWDAATGQLEHTLVGHEQDVWTARYSPDGRTIVTASSDNTARQWDAVTGQALGILQGHTGIVGNASYSPDGKTILTYAWDGTARLWAADTGQTRFVLQGHSAALRYTAFSRDGTRIVTTSEDGTARIWDVATGQERAVLRGHTERVLWAAFSPDGATVLTGSDDGTAKLWNAAMGQEQATLAGHTGGVQFVAFSPDGQRILTTSADGTARQYLAHLDALWALAARRVTRGLTPEERAAYLGVALPVSTPISAPTSVTR